MMLIIADHILPLACVDYFGEEESSVVAVVKGAERMLAPPPLLVNLGKVSANVYTMDMTVCLSPHPHFYQMCLFGVTDACNLQHERMNSV